MKEEISRIYLIIYVTMLILSGFIPTVSGDSAIWFSITGIFAIPPIIAGPKIYRILGITTLIIAVTLAVFDYNAGRRDQQKLETRFKQTNKEVP